MVNTSPDSLATLGFCVGIIVGSCLLYFLYIFHLQDVINSWRSEFFQKAVFNPILEEGCDSSGSVCEKESETKIASERGSLEGQVAPSRSILVLISLSLFANVLFAGIIFGWPLLQLLFEDEGVLRPSSCGQTGVCYQQKDKIMLIYTISSTFQACFTFPGGYMVDTLGPLKSVFIAMLMVTAGLFLFAFSGLQDFYGLLSASILVSCGGGLSFTTSFLCGFLVDKKYLSAYFAAANCMFDGSTVMFFVVYQIYMAGVSRKSIFLAYSVLSIVVYISLLYFWFIHEKDIVNVKDGINKDNDKFNTERSMDHEARDNEYDRNNTDVNYIIDVNSIKNASESDSVQEDIRNIFIQLGVSNVWSDIVPEPFIFIVFAAADKEVISLLQAKALCDRYYSGNDFIRASWNSYLASRDMEDLIDTLREGVRAMNLNDNSEIVSISNEKKIGKINQDQSGPENSGSSSYSFKRMHWTQQLRSKQFAFLAVYISINLLRSNCYMGTAANMLQSLGDASDGNVYTQVFSAILPCGFVFIPLIDATLKRFGFIKTFDSINAMALLYIAISLIPVLPLQVLTFIIFCAYRSYFYSITGAFTAHTFGPINVGRIYGIAFILAGFLNFLAWPAQVLTAKYANGDYTYLTVFLLVLLVPQYFVTRRVLFPLFISKECTDII